MGEKKPLVCDSRKHSIVQYSNMEKRSALKIGMQHTAFFVWAPIQAVILCLLDTPHDQGKLCSQGPNTQKMPSKCLWN